MEKIKFGIEITVLILAFPVLFFIEMHQAENEIKGNQLNKAQTIEIEKIVATGKVKDVASSEFTATQFSKLMITNN